MLTNDYLLSASEDCSVKLWSPMLGQMQNMLTVENQWQTAAATCALSQNGQFLVVGYTDNTVTLYDLKNKSKFSNA
jgi:WD40 repeat protein